MVNRAIAEGQSANIRELDEDVVDGPEAVLTESSQAIREIEATVVRLTRWRSLPQALPHLFQRRPLTRRLDEPWPIS